MNQKAKEVVNAVMGVMNAQMRPLSKEEYYDALDELSDRIADKFAGAKSDLDKPTFIGMDVASKDAPLSSGTFQETSTGDEVETPVADSVVDNSDEPEE